jgi:hypothetical protein
MRKFYLFLTILLFPFLSGVNISQANPINEAQARLAALNWLSENPQPFGENMGRVIKDSVAYKGDTAGDVGYYLVMLEPNGWLILPADDSFWPTITFGAGVMTKEQFESSLWYSITVFNRPEGNNQSPTRGATPSSEDDFTVKAQKRWSHLLEGGTESNNVGRKAENAPQDVRVAPLIETAWFQDELYAEHLSPRALLDSVPGSADILRDLSARGVSLDESMLVGCNALATGQIMHYFMTKIYQPIDLMPASSRSYDIYIGSMYMPRTTILVISCDFETGKIYTGYSNVEIAQRDPGRAKTFFISNDIPHYRNAKGEPYMGGDTILRHAITVTSDDLDILKKDMLNNQ